MEIHVFPSSFFSCHFKHLGLFVFGVLQDLAEPPKKCREFVSSLTMKTDREVKKKGLNTGHLEGTVEGGGLEFPPTKTVRQYISEKRFRKAENLFSVLPKTIHVEVFHFRLCPHLASKDDFNQLIFILLIHLRCSINFRNTSLERTLAAPCQTHSGTTSHQQAIPAHLSVQQKLPLCLGTWKNEMNHHWSFRSFHHQKKNALRCEMGSLTGLFAIFCNFSTNLT